MKPNQETYQNFEENVKPELKSNVTLTLTIIINSSLNLS